MKVKIVVIILYFSDYTNNYWIESKLGKNYKKTFVIIAPFGRRNWKSRIEMGEIQFLLY